MDLNLCVPHFRLVTWYWFSVSCGIELGISETAVKIWNNHYGEWDPRPTDKPHCPSGSLRISIISGTNGSWRLDFTRRAHTSPTHHWQKELAIQWTKACPFPSGMVSCYFRPSSRWVRYKALLPDSCFLYLSYQSWSKGGIGGYAYCISVKVMTLIGIKGGNVHGIENEKASCEQSHSAWERCESLSRSQPVHLPEDQGWMSFHSQVRARNVCSRVLWFSSDEDCDLLGEISRRWRMKNMGSLSQGSSGGCHWLLLVLEIMCRDLS